MDNFGNRLRRAFAGASNSTIARKLGVSAAAVSNYMNGRVPDADTLLKIRSLTNCNLDWLLSGDGDDGKPRLEIRPPTLEELFERRIREVVRQEIAQLNWNTEPIANFELEQAVQKYDNAIPVLAAWYAHDGVSMPPIERIGHFGGWENKTLEEKIQAVRELRDMLDNDREFEERAAARNVKHSK